MGLNLVLFYVVIHVEVLLLPRLLTDCLVIVLSLVG